MSSNYEYKGVINKRDLRKVFLHAITMEHTWNYERMMNDGYLYSMLPALQKIYTNPEDLKEACKRHLEFFNTTPQCITLPLGITVAMEEQRANDMENFDTTSISSVKTAIMGPLAGIGDTIGWAMIPTIFGSIAASMGMQGNPLGIIMWAVFTFAFLAVRILEVEWGYNMGINVVTKLGQKITVFTEACSVLGLTVVGALIASVVNLKTGLSFTNGDVTMNVQDLIDGVMPKLLPVVAVALIYFFMNKKQVKMTKMILIIIILSWVGAATGIFTA